ncbi:MAG: hypothetical protein CSA79_00260 [Thiothrix nivea]|nr:MAG: hypothetical protein CSA79_00260 [Thiothrix nivea]
MNIPTTIISLSLLLMVGNSLYGCAANESTTAKSNSSSTPPAVEHSNHTDEAFIGRLAKLQSKNPVTDAQNRIAAGERYFLCHIGRSRTVPGLDAATYQRASKNCQTRCLEGVTDAVLGDHHLRYLQAAVAYSASWNKVMINVCQ